MTANNNDNPRTIVADVLIAKDGEGNLGNLTVEGSIFCDSISAESLPETVFTGTITGDGHTSTYGFTHNLRSLSPSCTITDEDGNVCVVDISYPSANVISIQFPDAVAEGEVFNVSIRK